MTDRILTASSPVTSPGPRAKVETCAAVPTPVLISGTGACVPSRVLTNTDLTTMVDTNEEWIRSRTGIIERRLAADHETSGSMAAEAAREAIAKAGLAPADIDLVIVATITPDRPFPSTACHVQTALGMRPVPAFDVEAACSGFLYIIDIATGMLCQGSYQHALIIGTEKLSAITDWQDRSTCILFGDGAGAAVLSRGQPTAPGEPPHGILDTVLGADGREGDILQMPGGGCRIPATVQSVEDRQHFLKMNGREVFKLAVRVMEKATLDLLARNHLSVEDIACIIPHQANIRIIEMLSARLQIPMSRFFINLDRYGNTSAASVPMALHEALDEGLARPGEYAVMVGFGAGLTWGASLVRWP